MTRQEIEKRIDELGTRAFFIKMADHWDYEDRKVIDEIYKELHELEKELKKA